MSGSTWDDVMEQVRRWFWVVLAVVAAVGAVVGVLVGAALAQDVEVVQGTTHFGAIKASSMIVSGALSITGGPLDLNDAIDIDGSSDEVQLAVTGYTTQTNDLVQFDGGLVDIGGASYGVADGDNDVGIAGVLEVDGELEADGAIDADAGVSVAGGTLDVDDAVDVDGSSNEVQLAVTGYTTQTNDLVQFDGGLVDIGGGTYTTADGDDDVGINGDLEVNGAIDADGGVAISGGLLNVDDAVDVDGSSNEVQLAVTGYTTQTNDLAFFSGGLVDIGGGTYGNADGDNDLGIEGDLEVNGAVYADGGAVVSGGLLNVDDAVDVDGSSNEVQLAVTGYTTQTNDLVQFDGGLVDIGGGTYTTADGDDDAGINGDLEVNGAIDADGGVAISGGLLNLDDALDLDGSSDEVQLAVTGYTTQTSDLVQFDGGLVDIGGGTYGNADGDNDLGIEGDLEVNGAVYADGGVVVSGGLLNVDDAVDVDGSSDEVQLAVTGYTTQTSDLAFFSGGLVDIGGGTYGNADGDNDLGIDGDLEVNGAVYADGGAVVSGGLLNVDDAVDVDGSSDEVQLAVTGYTTQTSDLAFFSGGLVDIGGGTYSTADGDDDLGVDGDLEVNGVFDADSTASFAGTVSFADTVTMGVGLILGSTTITDSQTLTPTYGFYSIASTGATEITLTACTQAGQFLYLYGESNNTITVTDSSIRTGDGGVVAFNQYDLVAWMCAGTEWILLYEANNQ